MIVFSLQCGHDHGFEAWFRDARAYASQRRARKIACPQCGDTRITKVPAGAHVATGAARETPLAPSDGAKAFREALEALHRHVAETCEHVGPRFAEEARKIHYGESAARDIYGEASNSEADALADEGVPFARVPKLPEGDA